jgi:hypothetical protein
MCYDMTWLDVVQTFAMLTEFADSCQQVDSSMLTLVLWIVKPCELVDRYQCFGGAYCLHV